MFLNRAYQDLKLILGNPLGETPKGHHQKTNYIKILITFQPIVKFFYLKITLDRADQDLKICHWE